MIDFVDEVPHSNDILYYITETVDTQGNKAYRIELATEVTPGTPMNKVLFDSIKNDLTNLQSNKLNISSKATQAQAETGTDNTNYMTALRVKQAIEKKYLPSGQMSIKTGTVIDGGTIPQTSGYTNHVYFVSPNMDNYAESSDTNEIFGAGYKIECTVNQQTRAVTAKAWIKINKGNTSSQAYKSLQANYIEIAYN